MKNGLDKERRVTKSISRWNNLESFSRKEKKIVGIILYANTRFKIYQQVNITFIGEHRSVYRAKSIKALHFILLTKSLYCIQMVLNNRMYKLSFLQINKFPFNKTMFSYEKNYNWLFFPYNTTQMMKSEKDEVHHGTSS